MRKFICWLFGHKYQINEDLQCLQDAGIIAGEVELRCAMCGKRKDVQS